MKQFITLGNVAACLIMIVAAIMWLRWIARGQASLTLEEIRRKRQQVRYGLPSRAEAELDKLDRLEQELSK